MNGALPRSGREETADKKAMRVAQVTCDQPNLMEEIRLQLGDDPFALVCLFAAPCADFKQLIEDASGAFEGADVLGCTTAGELGADYVSFGPVAETALGDGRLAETELFEWWSQMIEVPVVAEGALTEDRIRTLAPFSDFFGIGDEIWGETTPADALKGLYQAML